MLTREDNELLTRVGPGTPMGEWFRRFWLPALLSEELPRPDGPPIRLRILGEDLVAFRDTQGRAAIIEAYCPHRGTFLFWGRNEECGLRCTYHGWKFDVDGNCVDTPNEPAESTFKDKIKIRSYPIKEWAGLIWVYMGPKEKTPELPQFEWAQLPPGHCHVSKWLQETNWLQGMEGEIDTSHASHLHRWLDPAAVPSYQNVAVRPDLVVKGASPRLTVRETDYGFFYGGRRPAHDGKHYWRVIQWLLPTYSLIPSPDLPKAAGRAWVPIDDENTSVFSYTFNADQPLTAEELEILQTGVRFPPALDRCVFRLKDGYLIDTWRPRRNRGNDYLIDRETQQTENYSGIEGINDQDRSVQETMRSAGGTWGAIADRTKERLGTSDVAIIAARNRLLKMVREFQRGIDPYAAYHGELYNIRPLDVVSAEDDLLRLVSQYEDHVRVRL